MIIRDFLLWARNAPSDHRAEAVGSLAQTLLSGDLTFDERREAELAILAMLDDPAPMVRLAIAEALAAADEAPRSILMALLQDRSDIANLVLQHSPVLNDAELVDYAAIAEASGQIAIARRARVSPAVAGALAEVGPLQAILVLLANPGAVIADVSLNRIVERFGHERAIRDVLLRRADLPVEVRLSLAGALARSLSTFVAGSGAADSERLELATRDAYERTVVSMTQGAGAEAVRRMVTHLCVSGQLTPSLVLRALLSRGLPFVEAVFSELGGLTPRRTKALLQEGGAGRDALYGKAGLPRSLRQPILAVLAELYEAQATQEAIGLSRPLILRALGACSEKASAAVLTLLRRYEAEAAREEARQLAQNVAAEADLLELTKGDLRAEPRALPAPDGIAAEIAQAA